MQGGKVQERVISLMVIDTQSESRVSDPMSHILRPAWLRDNLQDAKRHAVPKGTVRESKRPQRFLSYMALISHIIDFKSPSYDEAAGQ